jgi:hypothetical protein
MLTLEEYDKKAASTAGYMDLVKIIPEMYLDVKQQQIFRVTRSVDFVHHTEF